MERPRLTRTRSTDRLVLECVEVRDLRREFMEELGRGLSRAPKSLAPKYFYDEKGSALFERITELEEYYPTRSEAAILGRYGADIIAAAGTELSVVELGSGSSTKTRLLLDVLARRQERLEYIPIDISPTVVAEFGEQLLQDYPSLYIHGLICDYHRALGRLEGEEGRRRLFLFLGSSLGNYNPAQAVRLLQAVRQAMRPGDHLLLGLDMKKDPAVLHRAYNDAEGVTAAFNMNLLERIDRELGGHFSLERFRHAAFYNAAQGRIEMHLESLESQLVPVDALARAFSFRKGETIHTENSYKFDRSGLEAMLRASGLSLRQQWQDEREWFSLNLAAPTG